MLKSPQRKFISPGPRIRLMSKLLGKYPISTKRSVPQWSISLHTKPAYTHDYNLQHMSPSPTKYSPSKNITRIAAPKYTMYGHTK